MRCRACRPITRTPSFSPSASELRAVDRWCVTDGAYCYRKDGHKSYEPTVSSRTDRFKKAYRFSLDDALALAKRLAPKMTVNWHTVESMLASEAAKANGDS